MLSSRNLPGLPCGDRFKGVPCVRGRGHDGPHQAKFPGHHCHVDENGTVTPDVEQPFRWQAVNGRRQQVPPRTRRAN